MECEATGFVRRMRLLLDSDRPVVATVARRGGGFIDEVKRRSDIDLREVTPRNREGLPKAVLEWLGPRIAGTS